MKTKRYHQTKILFEIYKKKY